MARHVATGVSHVTMVVVLWVGSSRVIEGQLTSAVDRLHAVVGHVTGLTLNMVNQFLAGGFSTRAFRFNN